MRKELDNSYIAEVNESGKFLGKNKVEVHGGDNNTVSNVLSTVDGGVSLHWNPMSLISSETGEGGYKAEQANKIIPAGSIVMTYWDENGVQKYVVPSFYVNKQEYGLIGGHDLAYIYEGRVQTDVIGSSVIGVTAVDVDFTETNVVNNVPVAKSADLYTMNYYFAALETVDPNSDVVPAFEYSLGTDYESGYTTFVREHSGEISLNEPWFAKLNLNIK